MVRAAKYLNKLGVVDLLLVLLFIRLLRLRRLAAWVLGNRVLRKVFTALFTIGCAIDILGGVPQWPCGIVYFTGCICIVAGVHEMGIG